MGGLGGIFTCWHAGRLEEDDKTEEKRMGLNQVWMHVVLPSAAPLTLQCCIALWCFASMRTEDAKSKIMRRDSSVTPYRILF